MMEAELGLKLQVDSYSRVLSPLGALLPYKVLSQPCSEPSASHSKMHFPSHPKLPLLRSV
jgi:hypothetical protein